MNINKHNEKAWDLSVMMKNRFTLPLDDHSIEQAKGGKYDLHLTPKTAIPKEWLMGIKGKDILVLAGAGGRQAILLALAGANITLVDISDKQLDKDRLLNDSLKVNMNIIKSSADELDFLEKESFDFIINPLSNCFFENLDKVWMSCSKLLKRSGELIYAFNNPIAYLFNFEKANKGEFILKYSSPYSDLNTLSVEEKLKYLGAEVPMEFGHSLTEQLATMMKYNMAIIDMFEDSWDYDDPINKYFPAFINIRAKKMS